MALFNIPGLSDTLRAEEDREFSRAGAVGRMSLGELIGSTAYGGSAAALRGIGEAGAGLLGYDIRSDAVKRAAAGAAVQRRLQGVDVNDPAVYLPALIEALKAEGFVAESFEAAKEYRNWQDRQRTAERLETKDAETARLAQLRMDSRDKTSPLMQAVDKIAKIEDELAALPDVSPKRAPLVRQRDLIINSLQKSQGVKAVDSGDTISIFTSDGTLLREIPKGVSPDTKARIDAKGAGVAVEDNGVPTVDGAVVGQDPPGATAVSDSVAGSFSKDVANTGELIRALADFKDEFSGSPLARVLGIVGAQDFVLNIDRLKGGAPEASLWWMRYKAVVTQIRNALFGATLTKGEELAFREISAATSDEPDTARGMISQMIVATIAKLETTVRSYRDSGRKTAGFQRQIVDLRRDHEAAKRLAQQGGPKERKDPLAPEAAGVDSEIAKLKQLARTQGPAAATKHFDSLPPEVKREIEAKLRK